MTTNGTVTANNRALVNEKDLWAKQFVFHNFSYMDIIEVSPTIQSFPALHKNGSFSRFPGSL